MMKAGSFFGITFVVAAIATSPFLGCVGDEPNGTGGSDGGIGDGASGDSTASDGASSDADGSASCGTCSVACVGNKCPTAPVQLTTWCSDFVNPTNATNDSSCVLLQSGDVYCWGYNGSGELGVGDQTNRTVATKIATDTNGDPFSGIVEISMGVAHACARKSDGSIWCWGRNDEAECGQLASGTPILRPTRVASLSGYRHIFAKGFISCGIDASSQVTCWGSNDQDALGNTGPNTPTPTAISFQGGNLTTSNMAIGDQGGCAQVIDKAYCWGTNRNMLLGKLGTGGMSATPLEIYDPTETNALGGVAGVAHSRFTAFVLLSSGVALGWGDNDYGALGYDTAMDNRKDPEYFGGGLDAGGAVGGIVQIAAGLAHTCVRTNDGSILCAGINSFLQQGNNVSIVEDCSSGDSTDFAPGPAKCTTTPLPLATFAGPPVKGATDVAAGCGLTCFTASDNKVYCEGNDTFGQTARASAAGDVACTFDGLGDGGLRCAGTPAPVMGLP